MQKVDLSSALRRDFHIVILSFNHPDLTSRCVTSVLNFCNPDCVWLIHNGSSVENTLRLKALFPDIHHDVILKNAGYSAGANAGLRSGFKNSDSVLFLTNDTELIALPENCPRGALTSVTCFRRKTSGIDSVMGQVNIKTGQLKHLKRLVDVISNQESTLRIYVPGTAFWMQKKTFETLGGFNEIFHTYWEDVDLSIRAQMAGMKLEACSFTQVRHGIGKTCHKNPFYTFFLFQRNQRLFMKKNNFTTTRFRISFFFRVLKKSKFSFRKIRNVYSSRIPI